MVKYGMPCEVMIEQYNYVYNVLMLVIMLHTFIIVFLLGEKLSRQELQSNNVIKKLRSREKLNENTISTIKYVDTPTV